MVRAKGESPGEPLLSTVSAEEHTPNTFERMASMHASIGFICQHEHANSALVLF